jgi:ubiquinone/menaquinone biosynthesis C-methylase UbiE
MSKTKSIINDQFWNLTFKTGLYDFLVMSSYDHSLKTIAESANISNNSSLLDVGCGSGRLLLHIGSKLKETESQWTGLELTHGGISACKNRICNMGLEDNARVLPADMCESLPIEKESIDIAFAHFSTYVISDREKRITAFKNIAKTLKFNGMIFIAAPAKNYNAKDQVRSSITIDKYNPDLSFTRRLRNKLLFTTLGHYSETVISKRIKEGIWCSFNKDEIEQEANDAGLKLKWVKEIYGDTSLMAALCK